MDDPTQPHQQARNPRMVDEPAFTVSGRTLRRIGIITVALLVVAGIAAGAFALGRSSAPASRVHRHGAALQHTTQVTGTHRNPAVPSTTTSTPGPSTTTTTTVPPTTTTTPVPTLGVSVGQYPGIGYGEVQPNRIQTCCDELTLVTNVQWQSWGGPQATGTGDSDYAQGVCVLCGTSKQVTVVAFDLGYCGSTYAYQAVTWYFPEEGQSFNPDNYINACTDQPSPGFAAPGG